MSEAADILARKEEGRAGLGTERPSLVEVGGVWWLRVCMQGEITGAERLLARLRELAPGSELVARLECVVADRLSPALAELTSMEEELMGDALSWGLPGRSERS
jgi:hypothetical protein